MQIWLRVFEIKHSVSDKNEIPDRDMQIFNRAKVQGIM